MNLHEHENAEYVRISGLDNPFEAQLLGSILEERGIPHRIRSHHDTAYDGLFQMQKGWGEIAAPESRKNEILEILEQLRQDASAGKYENSP
ncbi:MAG: DUF2007 domain-containing protein [Desulfobacterales bacterium]|nr:DUF2007 domain-containing protein [Desulfobacterales bacterium]MBS3756218.1 DUF2007 domain-containing protein [Desulfobacterales bacterium]